MNGGYNVVNVGMIVAGAILIYSGVKDVSPPELFRQLFMDSKEGKSTFTPVTPSAQDDSTGSGK